MEDNGLNVKYRETKIISSKLECSRFKGQFAVDCRQTTSTLFPKSIAKHPFAMFDLEVEIGGPEEPIAIEASIRSFFDIEDKAVTHLTDADQAYCEEKGFLEADKAFAKLVKLHIGQPLHLTRPPAKK